VAGRAVLLADAEEEWKKRSWSKLPEGGALEVETVRLG
jgi:hypothetical protein